MLSEIREIVERARADAHRLAEQLNIIQSRLGTPQEQPDDINQAREVAHGWRNALCKALLGEPLLCAT